jgi:hypothetical protein
VKRAILACCSLMLFGVTVGAQSRPSTPEEVVRDFFQAQRAGRWLDAAQLMDLESFDRLRSRTIANLAFARTFPRITADEMRRVDPDMPLAVAEYQAKKQSESIASFDPLSAEFAHVPTIDSLRALPLAEVAARWLEARDPRWQAHLSVERSKGLANATCASLPDSVTSQFTEKLMPLVATVLGVAQPSDSVRYVVVGQSGSIQPSDGSRRSDWEANPSPSVLTLRSMGGKWRIVPALDMPNTEGFGGAMAMASMTCELRPTNTKK